VLQDGGKWIKEDEKSYQYALAAKENPGELE
jgi:hypothetical protein